MPFGLPPPGQVGGAWGAGMFPPWFEEEAASRGWDMLTAANEFSSWVQSGPIGADGQPIDFGWYWNSFRPGGQNHGQVFDQNEHNLTYNGQTVPNQPPPPPGQVQPPPDPGTTPPPGPTPPPTPTQPQNTLPPRPDAPPNGQDPSTGNWRPRVVNGVRQWVWVRNANQPPAGTPPPPAGTPPPMPPGQTPPAGQPPKSGPPVVTYPSTPAATPPAQPAQPAQGQQQTQQAAYPLGGGQQQQAQSPAANPPQTPGGQNAPAAPNRPAPTPPAGGGAAKAKVGSPPTLSQMDAQRWNRPGGGLLG